MNELKEFNEPCNVMINKICGYGELFGKKLKYTVGDDLEKYVKKLGGNIKNIEDDYQGPSYIEVYGESHFTIFIPWYTSDIMNRFSICHELGHYVLHSKFGNIPGKTALHGNVILENEANCFACGFLMPKDKFNEYLKKGYTIVEMSAVFKVSIILLEARKKYLKNQKFF